MSTLRRQVLGHPPVVAGNAWTAEPVVRPGDATHTVLALPLRFGRYPLRLSASVGTGGWNRPPDVRAVQERLHDLRLLDDPSYQAEIVDPARPGRVPDGQFGLTIGAISVLREQFLGIAAPALGRLEPAHPVVRALDNPLYGLKTSIDLGDSVGWVGVNEVADVRRVLRRLRDLRFLPQDHASAEEARVGALGTVPVGLIGRTIDAIEAWRAACRVANRATPIVPDDASHRRLVWPLVAPPTALALTQPVGDTAAAGANVTAEARRLLDRLHELGYVTTADLLAERHAMVGANVPRASIPRTIAGLRATQATAAGNPTAAPDGIVSPRGTTHRVLGSRTGIRIG